MFEHFVIDTIMMIIIILIIIIIRPITCLSTPWKVLTGILPEERYNLLNKNAILPEEKKITKKLMICYLIRVSRSV